MRVADVARAMEAIAPPRYAAAWDNVGLLVGDPDGELGRVLIAVDLTRAVLDEAVRTSSGAVVAYHPPIFDAQKRFVAGSIGYEAARAGVAVYCPHTALDVAPGGTNDVLADAIGVTGRTPLRAVEPADDERKLVTFVPPEHVEAVAAALASAGAGTIGKYTSCSFRTAGKGTFFGEEGSAPVVGAAGRLEHVDEARLEMVLPVGRAADVVRALRAAHPYEEPAFDLVAPGDGYLGSRVRSGGRPGADHVGRGRRADEDVAGPVRICSSSARSIGPSPGRRSARGAAATWSGTPRARALTSS